MTYCSLMFYEIHQVDLVRLLGGHLGMLPRFQVFETRELKTKVKEEGEPEPKRKKEAELKNGRKFSVDGKLEQKSTGF